MPSTRPKIQAYLDEALMQRFEEWKQERGLQGDSAALTELLKEFFEVGEEPNYGGIPDDRLRILIQEELWSSGRQDFIEGIKTYAQQTITKEVLSFKDYWQAFDQRDELKALKAIIDRLEARIETLEKICEPIEGLAEISNKLHRPPETEALTCSKLARRLGVNHGTISKKRGKPDFEEWTKAKDPDAIAWRYDREKQKFFPVEGRA